MWLPKALKSCPKSNKLLNLVTLLVHEALLGYLSFVKFCTSMQKRNGFGRKHLDNSYLFLRGLNQGKCKSSHSIPNFQTKKVEQNRGFQFIRSIHLKFFVSKKVFSLYHQAQQWTFDVLLVQILMDLRGPKLGLLGKLRFLLTLTGRHNRSDWSNNYLTEKNLNRNCKDSFFCFGDANLSSLKLYTNV